MKKVNLSIFIVVAIHFQSKAQFMEPNFINNDTDIYSASFIAEWGGDTASIETFTIVGNHLFGKAIHLYPEPHLRQFNYYFNPDGSIRTMDIVFLDLANTSIPLKTKSGFLPYRIKMNSSNEVVDFRMVDKEGEKQFTHLSKRMDFFGGWTPIFGQWQWLTDLMIKGKLNRELKFLNYVIGDYNLEMTKLEGNVVIFDSDITAPITFYLDQKHKIKKINAIGSPWNYIIERHEPIDLEKYCKQFSKKKVIGDPSPHEKVDIEISDCRISIDYGRPSKRGREIFGSVVPFGKIWRTGAGSPTILSTTKDLSFNGVIIPKGHYNLFTKPDRDKWKLIFNAEKEAWGSAYRKEFDFASVDMVSKKTKEVVEKFTIEIIQKEVNGGILQLSWDKTIATIEFEIRN